MHPLAEDFSKLKDQEIEQRLQDLSSKYWKTHNAVLQHQIATFIDMYKAEMAARRAKIWQEQYQKRDKGLDNLINVQ